MMLHPMLWVICVEKNYITEICCYSNRPTPTWKIHACLQETVISTYNKYMWTYNYAWL